MQQHFFPSFKKIMIGLGIIIVLLSIWVLSIRIYLTWGDTTAELAYTEEDIIIDGRLSESSWKNEVYPFYVWER